MNYFMPIIKILRQIKYNYTIVLIGVPVATILMILRPFIHIRTNSIDSKRLGHFIGMSEIYLCEKKLGLHKKFCDLIYLTGKPVNSYIHELYDKKIGFSVSLVRIIDMAFQKIIKTEIHKVPISGADYQGIFEKLPPQICLDTETKKLGENWLLSQGIGSETEVVLFANRDSRHLNKIIPGVDWSYHDYRDSDINKMGLMAKTMKKKGYAVIRLGADVSSPLKSQEPMIIDYPVSHRTDKLDVYLASRCKFFIATTSGIGDLGRMFRKPTACTNVAPFTTVMRLKTQLADIWIPKLHWSVSKKRLMTFKEIMDASADTFCRSEDYHRAGIELIENTPEDIEAMALEIDGIIGGYNYLNEDDNDLYKKFWQIVLRGKEWDGQSRIAISFLRSHRDLLS